MPKPNLRISPKPREVLKDEQRRAEYDQLWQHRNDPGFGRQRQTHEQSYSQQDFDDIFSSMFGQQAHQRRRQHAARGHDLEIEVAVFLEETLAEQTRTISYNLPVYNVFGMIESETPKTLNVKIPAGVVDGQRIRLKGRGTPGENGGPNGDLWLVIHIAPHPLFDIVGHNLGDRPAAGAMGGRAGRESDGAHPEREHSADGATGQSGRAATAYQRERTREQNPHRRFVRRY